MNQQEREQANRIMARADRMSCITFYHDITTNIQSVPVSLHTFKFEVQISNPNSDIDPIELKLFMESLLDTGRVDLNLIDLNDIADSLYIQIIEKHPNTAVWIKVSADGGIGAFVKYDTHRPQLISV